MKFERRSMTTWLLIGSSLSVRAVPLDLPRTALLRLAGDGQSLGNDPDILQEAGIESILLCRIHRQVANYNPIKCQLIIS